MSPLTILALLVIGAALEAAGRRERPRRFLVLKPLATTLILARVLLAPPARGATWMGLGLGLSLLGDVCLLGRSERAFLGGLGSFLLAHLAFMTALLHGVPPGWPPAWTWVLAPCALGLLAWLLPATGRLKVPVAIYAGVLLGMVLAAARAAQVHPGGASTLALAGALSFLVSDTLLATDRFRGPLPKGQVAVLATYWLAVGLLAASVAPPPGL